VLVLKGGQCEEIEVVCNFVKQTEGCQKGTESFIIKFVRNIRLLQ